MDTLSPKEAARTWAVLRALEGIVKAGLASNSEPCMASLQEYGVERVVASLPDGTEVATVTRANPKATTSVADPDALLEWAKVNAKYLVRHVPRATTVVPAHDELDTAKLAEVLPYLQLTPHGTLVDGDGAEWPGVVHTRAKAPYLSVSFAEGGKVAIARAIAQGGLAEVMRPMLTDGGE